jgi:hypothetical protein
MMDRPTIMPLSTHALCTIDRPTIMLLSTHVLCMMMMIITRTTRKLDIRIWKTPMMVCHVPVRSDHLSAALAVNTSRMTARGRVHCTRGGWVQNVSMDTQQCITEIGPGPSIPEQGFYY